MKKRSLVLILAALVVALTMPGCSSHPEKTLLSRYFNSVSMNDVQTLSTMALEPVMISAASWKITGVSEEKIEPATLGDLNKAELEFKKQIDQHTAPVLEASDLLANAKDEYDTARTAGAKFAAKAKVDAAQKKYDEEYARHNELKKNYNEAKAAAQKEEDIAAFSIGNRQLTNIRELTGQVHSKDVDLEVTDKEGQLKKFKIAIKMYSLKDEALNVAHRGRWVIIKMEPV
jgi:hypothetical protein